MSMVKRFLEDYCEAKHPDDYDAQDALFESICNGTIQPDTDEMIRVINEYKDRKDGRPSTQGDAGASVRSPDASIPDPAAD